MGYPERPHDLDTRVDGIIECGPAPPAAIYDVSLAPAADLNILRDTLKPLALERERERSR